MPAVFVQQIVQLPDAFIVNRLLNQAAVVGQADVRGGAAGQSHRQQIAFRPAGVGDELQLDVIRIAEMLLSIMELPAVGHIQTGNLAVIGLHTQGNPVVLRKSGACQPQQQRQGKQNSQCLLHDGNPPCLFRRGIPSAQETDIGA